MFRLFECCALSFFERFVLSFSLKIERFVSDSAEIWICGLYNVLLDKEEFGAHTTFDDSNNLLIRTFGEASRNLIFKEFGGRISYQTDRKYEHRKSYAVVMRKPDNNPVRYITVLYPVDSATGPVIKGQFVNTGNEDKVSVNVTINKKLYNLSYSLNKRR